MITSFNIPSTGFDFENKFIAARRVKKLNFAATQEKKVNPVSLEVDTSNLNPDSDYLTPIEQIQKNSHVEDKPKILENLKINDSLDVLKLNVFKKEELPDNNDIEVEFKN